MGHILSFLPYSPLFHVLFVSRRLRDAVEPFVYQHIVAVRPKADVSWLLLRTLKARADLRNHVNALSIKALVTREGVQMCSLDIELFALVSELRDLELSPPRHNLHVWQLFHLHTLRLHFGLEYEHHTQPGKLPISDTSPLGVIVRHLWMPSLRTLEIDALNFFSKKHIGNPFFIQYEDGSNSAQNPSAWLAKYSRTSPVTTLRLTDCSDIDFGIIPDILLSLKKLEHFTFVAQCSVYMNHEHEPGVSSATIAWALEPHANTLTELIIAGDNAASFLKRPSFFTLAHYHGLKRLAIPEPFFLCNSHYAIQDLLPSQLEDLQLQIPVSFAHPFISNSDIDMPAIRQLSQAKLESLPQLKSLILWNQQGDCWAGLSHIDPHLKDALTALKEDFWPLT